MGCGAENIGGPAHLCARDGDEGYDSDCKRGAGTQVQCHQTLGLRVSEQHPDVPTDPGQQAEESMQLYSALVTLCDNNCVKILGARVCKERIPRQPLAQVLQREAETLLKAARPDYSTQTKKDGQMEEWSATGRTRSFLKTPAMCATSMQLSLACCGQDSTVPNLPRSLGPMPQPLLPCAKAPKSILCPSQVCYLGSLSYADGKASTNSKMLLNFFPS